MVRMGIESVELEAVVSTVMIVMIVVSAVAALPWTDRELRSSVRAFGTVAALPAALLSPLRRRAVRVP